MSVWVQVPQVVQLFILIYTFNSYLKQMENPIKISVTIELEGGVLSNESSTTITNTKSKSKKFKKQKNSQFTDIVLKTIPAKQHINMTKIAYLYMTSNECPEWAKIGEWNRLTPRQRLEQHLWRTCQHLKGKSYSYTILDD